MTEPMTDTPEKIWAWHEIDEDGHHKFWISNPDQRTGEETEYIRRIEQARAARQKGESDG